MSFARQDFCSVLQQFQDLGLLSRAEIDETLTIFEPTFQWRDCLEQSESVHVHVRVNDVSQLPHDRICALGGKAENRKDGYVKYTFPQHVNVILSSIDIAEDDWLPTNEHRARPYVDHIGVDLRTENAMTRTLFNLVPTIAHGTGWRTVAQGGKGKPVYCCHIEVGAKHWVYPSEDSRRTIPIEFALGPLKLNSASMGCDLRPIDPGHPKAALAVCAGHANC